MNGYQRNNVETRGAPAGTSPPVSSLDPAGRPFRDLLEHLPAGVIVHGKDMKVLAANQLAATLLGVSHEQLIGRAVSDPAWRPLRADGSPMPPTETPAFRALTGKTCLRNEILGIDRGPGLGTAWLIINAYVVCDNAGEATEVVVCFTDCTELKRTEQALQKSEQRLRLILQGSKDAPFDWNLVTNELYYPPRWWQMLGMEPDEEPVDPLMVQRRIHPDDRERVMEELQRALEGADEYYEIEARVQHKDGHYLPLLSRAYILRDEEGRAVRVSGTNTDLTQRKLAEQRIHELAYFDSLTGLPNRRFLMEELHKLLGRAQRHDCTGALLFIDLDNFKLLNDTLGHDIGDLLLKQAARRLRDAVREGDFVARLGGDEFVIVLDDLGRDRTVAAAEADQVGHKLLDVCAEHYALPERAYRSTASIGIALFDPHAEGVEVLLKQADVAMYQAKAAGRNTLRYFDPQMQAEIDRRYMLEHDLRDGLQRQEFRLYCQPQFDGAGRLAGAEILLRWQHPERGLVGPEDFIGAAESNGLILALGRWVLRESCRRLAGWAGEPVLGQIPLAVNVSAQQVHVPQFVPETLATIADAGANPAYLNLELTESLLAQDMENVIGKMNELQQAGVNFAIDDFGTGYSSLSYLKHFPLQKLKIDKSFVHDIHLDPHAAAIVEVIITLARKLGLDVIAEGVEDEDQHRFLRAGGCDAFQGYLLGRPMSIDEFERRYACHA